MVQDGLPKMDHSALTTLVDRWRPGTHSFHLPCGEMTVTLEDVAMILGLRVDGLAVTDTVNPAGWRDMAELLLGVRPPDAPAGVKDRKTTGVSTSWLTQHFGHPPPEGVAEGVIERFARAWMWHMVGGLLFPDGQGNTTSWMWLPILGQPWDTVGTFSWGSATLAWLYRQLCESCRRVGDNSNLGGCAYLLQIWMWERIPVGRPERHTFGAWPHMDEGSLPTVGVPWRNAGTVWGNTARRYLDYINALDCLTHYHVEWQPYSREEVTSMQLSHMCTMDRDLWWNVAPLIAFYVVEYHLPNHVKRQFGYLQDCPLEFIATGKDLHKVERRSHRGTQNWLKKHLAYINAWNLRHQHIVYGGTLHRDSPFQQYLNWLKENTRLKLKVAMTEDNIEELPSDPEDVIDEYDTYTRKGTQPERGPWEDYIGQQIGRFANEATQALSVPIGADEEASVLRGFIQRFRRGCRKIAFKLNCKTTGDVVHQAAPRRSGSQTTAGARGGGIVIGSPTRSTSRTPASRAASGSRGKGKQVVEEAEEEHDQEDSLDDSEGDDPTYGPDEIGSSQLHDAPPPTQATPPRKCRARARDTSDVASVNVLPTEPRRPRKPRAPYTPATSRKGG